MNRGPWEAKPLLISGASAYRKGEFLYQDFIYDDNGAGATPDPGDPRIANAFSRPAGTYTYPTGPGYAENAADLVELRVKALERSTGFRITLSSLTDPELVATTIAIGSSPEPLPLPTVQAAGTLGPGSLGALPFERRSKDLGRRAGDREVGRTHARGGERRPGSRRRRAREAVLRPRSRRADRRPAGGEAGRLRANAELRLSPRSHRSRNAAPRLVQES